MKLKKGLIAGMVLCCMPVLTACSAKDTIGLLIGSTSDETEKEVASVDLNAANIDENVEKPNVSTEMGDPVTYDLHAVAEPLTVEVSVTEGTLSYQWYRNNVDSNGGGTAIDGATENSYTPPTTESGTVYYYVVVTNTVGDGIQLSASGTKCVTITEQEAVVETSGSWQQDANGWWYQNADGTYPTNCWQEIDGQWYVFDESGYIRTGWYQDGDKWYYLQDSGAMARDTDVDGYHLGSDGVMQ